MSASRPSRLFAWMQRHWALTLVLMSACFVCFGVASVNLVSMLVANLRFLASYGVDAIREGGLVQLLGIAALGALAACFYVLFKVCEKALVVRLTHYDED